jgi:hypothetical protein
MIFRNSARAGETIWMGSLDPQAGETVRDFLAGEHDLLKLSGSRSRATLDLQIFLDHAAGRPVCVERSHEGELLVRAIGSSQSLLITGRTAEVICGYLDEGPVLMEDRAEMTLRRVTARN